MTASPPSGAVTFLFSDIEGSTQLWQKDRAGMETALARHHAILKTAISNHGGYVFQIVGDAFCAAFATPAEALLAAFAAQHALLDQAWGEVGPIRVRMALHAGTIEIQPTDYTAGEYRSGITLSRAARLLSAAHGGQVILSHVTAELVRDHLPAEVTLRDLGEHQLKDLIRPEHIFQACAPGLESNFPPLKTLDRHLHNLPIQLTGLIGRERELDEIRALVSAGRLMTLTGPGGTGKTRLALGVAAELGAKFKDGVWLVELAPLANADLVPQTVAAVLDVREQAGRPISAALIENLRPRELLLVLDNCEHLVAACAQLAEALLRACPNLHILATSQEALNIPGEMVWPVPSLSLPEYPLRREATTRPADLLQYEAIRLFAERASAASPAFSITERNAEAVAKICQQLDGMPLAIELAAARVRAFSVEQIAARLAAHERFRLLTAGSRTAPARQQTLEATLDWSYTLLSSVERTVLQRLSVFGGGWTLEAAEAVCGGDGVAAVDVLAVLPNLVDKSLVLVSAMDGEARYRLLETIRQYAHAKLAERAEADTVRDQHLEYYLHWAESAETKLIGSDQLAWLRRYEAERDNLQAALGWGQLAPQRAEAALRLAGACGRFWRLHGYLSEGRMHLSNVLSAAEGAATTGAARARAAALNWAAALAYRQSDYAATRAFCEKALALWRELGSAGRAGVAESLNILGQVTAEEGDYVTAPALFEESLALFREVGDPVGSGELLMQLGWAAMRAGDYEQAAPPLEEALPLLRTTGYTTLIAFALAGLAELAVRRGQYDRAVPLLEESLALRRERGEKWGLATALGSLGWVALRRGDFKHMRALLGESLTLRVEIGDRGGIAWCLEKLAEAALLWAQTQVTALAIQGYQRAATVFGAASGLRASVGSVVDPADQPEYDRHLAALRAVLGEAAFAAAWTEGRALTLDQALREALAETEQVDDRIGLSGQPVA